MTKVDEQISTVQEIIQRSSQIIGDCTHFMESTVIPKTYFSKCAYMLKILKRLSALEQEGLYTGPDHPTEKLMAFQAALEENNQHFIRRTYEKLLIELNGLKTKQGKIKRFNKYLESFTPYFDFLTPRNIQLLEEIKRELQRLQYRW